MAKRNRRSNTKQSATKAVAAQSRSKLENELQLYTTPHHITAALLRRENFVGKIWEPCVGLGDVAVVLKENGYRNVVCSDIHNWGYPKTIVQDFLKSKRIVDAIVTNPPHKNCRPFVKQAKALADKVAMLLPADFEAAVANNDLRADKVYPLKAVLTFTQSVKWKNCKNPGGRFKYCLVHLGKRLQR